MKRVKGQQRAAEAENGKEPKWWKKDIVAPIIVGIVLSIGGFGIWLIQKSPDEKYGDLAIASNVDSASVLLNQTLKGFTLSSRAIKLDSLKPGTYVLSVEKDGFASVDTSVKVVAGEITSVQANLISARSPEMKQLVKTEPAVTPASSIEPRQETKFYSITIRVFSLLKNANIMVDSVWVANAPNTISLRAGLHNLRVENEEYYYEEILQVPNRNLISIVESDIKRKNQKRDVP